MKKYYYLFGKHVTDAYFEDGIDGVIELMNRPLDIAIYEYEPVRDCPADLLSAADGWMGFAEITEEEFTKLKSLHVCEL